MCGEHRHVILNNVKDLNQVSLDALAVLWFRSFSRIADSSIGKTLLQDDVRYCWFSRFASHQKQANVILNGVKDLIHARPLALAAQWSRSFGHLLEKCTIKALPQDDVLFVGEAGFARHERPQNDVRFLLILGLPHLRTSLYSGLSIQDSYQQSAQSFST